MKRDTQYGRSTALGAEGYTELRARPIACYHGGSVKPEAAREADGLRRFDALGYCKKEGMIVSRR